jgi:hypothetical protein
LSCGAAWRSTGEIRSFSRFSLTNIYLCCSIIQVGTVWGYKGENYNESEDDK